MPTTIELKKLADFTPAEHAALDDLRGEITFGLPPTTWLPMELTPWRVLVWDDDRMVSHVGIMERTIEVGGRPVHVAGIRSVMTRPSQRGRGLASQAMERAQRFVDDSLPRAEHGLLLCLDVRVPLYSRLGWSVVPDRTIYDQPEGPTVSPVNTMVRPFRGRPWPQGEVNLKGLPW